MDRYVAPISRIAAAIPPGSGSVVMGTGIVSIALWFDGYEILSRVLLAIAGAIWILLGLALAANLAGDAERVRREARSAAGLTGVAGTAVIGARVELLGWSLEAIALLALAAVFLAVLLPPVLRHWDTPTSGTSFALPVAVQSLAALAATVAEHQGVRWLLYVAIVPFVLGLASYVFVIARFELRELVRGDGDQWIAGGALAISALAAGSITLGAETLGVLSGLIDVLEGISVALWVAAIAWIPPLVATEALWPRLAYNGKRWSTVFPAGMYAACSFVVGEAVHVPGIADFARAWVWIAVPLWLITFVGTARRLAAPIGAILHRNTTRGTLERELR
jgi:voltage-gated anion channel